MEPTRRMFVMGLVVGLIAGAVLALAGVSLYTFGQQVGVIPASASGEVLLGGGKQPAGDLVMSLSDAYLTRQVQASLPADAPLDRNATLSVQAGNKLVLDGNVKLALGPIQTGVPAKVSVGIQNNGGQLGLSLDQVQAGPVPIPQQLLPAQVQGAVTDLQTELNRQLSNNAALKGMKLSNVQTTPGHLNVAFSVAQP
ncbi:MAG: hypothetical protein U0768_11105 [Anaerolineae bacterium]